MITGQEPEFKFPDGNYLKVRNTKILNSNSLNVKLLHINFLKFTGMLKMPNCPKNFLFQNASEYGLNGIKYTYIICKKL